VDDADPRLDQVQEQCESRPDAFVREPVEGFHDEVAAARDRAAADEFQEGGEGVAIGLLRWLPVKPLTPESVVSNYTSFLSSQPSRSSCWRRTESPFAYSGDEKRRYE
jgi:hypothetical protein